VQIPHSSFETLANTKHINYLRDEEGECGNDELFT